MEGRGDLKANLGLFMVVWMIFLTPIDQPTD
jgi:hypothetical protein